MVGFISGFRDPDDPFGLKKLAAAGAVPEIRTVPTRRFGPDGQPIAANAPPAVPGPTLAEGAVPLPPSRPREPELVTKQPEGVPPDERTVVPGFAPAPTATRQPELLTTQGVDERRQVSAVDRYQAEIQKAMENKAWNEAIAGIAKMFPATPAPNRGPPQAPQIGRGIAPNPGDRLRGQATSQLASLIDQFKARSLISKTRPAAPGQNISFPRGRGSNLTDILRKLS